MLAGQRVLITGANGGIGLSICETFLKNNAKLVLFYNQKRTQIDRLLQQYESKKSMIEAHQVDLIDSTEIDGAMNKVLGSEQIDTFIHSVSLPLENKNFMDMQWANYQSHIEIQTKSFFQIMQFLIPSMKQKKHGKIISILTTASVGRPPSNMSDYIVGKYSLLGLSKSLAVELGRWGINVNCISPSMVDTHLTEKMPLKLKEMTLSQSPIGRLAEPYDVASAALFLSSKYSDYISGENLIVSGGQTMH